MTFNGKTYYNNNFIWMLINSTTYMYIAVGKRGCSEFKLIIEDDLKQEITFWQMGGCKVLKI